jgi:hypothetical protein
VIVALCIYRRLERELRKDLRIRFTHELRRTARSRSPGEGATRSD